MQRKHIVFAQRHVHLPFLCRAFGCMLTAMGCELNIDFFPLRYRAQAVVRSELEKGVYMRLPKEGGALYGMVVKLNNKKEPLWLEAGVSAVTWGVDDECVGDSIGGAPSRHSRVSFG